MSSVEGGLEHQVVERYTGTDIPRLIIIITIKLLLLLSVLCDYLAQNFAHVELRKSFWTDRFNELPEWPRKSSLPSLDLFLHMTNDFFKVLYKNNLEIGIRKSEFKFWACHSLAYCSWTSYLIKLLLRNKVNSTLLPLLRELNKLDDPSAYKVLGM